jgi:hypothetical protein
LSAGPSALARVTFPPPLADAVENIVTARRLLFDPCPFDPCPFDLRPVANNFFCSFLHLALNTLALRAVTVDPDGPLLPLAFDDR